MHLSNRKLMSGSFMTSRVSLTHISSFSVISSWKSPVNDHRSPKRE